MTLDTREFQRRVARIEKHKLAMAEHGARKRVGKDGLVEFVPKGGPLRLRFPWRALVLLAVFLFAGKVGIFRALGPEAYSAKLAGLEQGTQVDQIGARIMQVDPATRWVSDRIDAVMGQIRPAVTAAPEAQEEAPAEAASG